MRASLLRQRAFARAVFLTLVVTGAVAVSAGAAFASGPASLGVTGWQVYATNTQVTNPSSETVHGNPDEFAGAPAIPAQGDSGWVDCGPNAPVRFGRNMCPNSTKIGMAVSSILSGCWSKLNFTWFQALVSIPDGTSVSQFSVNMSGADDGARISLVNSAYPNGVTPANAYIYSGTQQATGDLSAYVVPGEVNRVIITQVDDCAVANNLNSALISLNGAVVTPAPSDTTAPTDSPSFPSGWSNSDATVNWNWTDGGSGIDAANCPQSSTSQGEGAITLSSTCRDLAGNSASDSVTVHVDKTAPVASPVASATGWSNSDVTVDWNWSDGGSGIDAANCPQSTTSSGEGTLTLSATCSDLAGNTGSDSVTVHVDKTAPAAAPVASATGWSNADVTVDWNWTDGGSGIDAANCPQSTTSSGEGTLTLSATCADLAGNTASQSATVQVDKTAPTIVYSGQTSYTVDQTVGIACSASDALSGLASSSCPGASGAAWTFGLGAHSLSASATDNAGNTGSGSLTFTVTVDATSLCNLAGSWAKNQGIANSLCTKLRAADAAAARGQAKTKQNDIDAFDHEVTAQSGKGFTASQAALLVQFAAAL